jgi:hypothetical protein
MPGEFRAISAQRPWLRASEKKEIGVETDIL